jgi:hypothetical protein
MQLAPLLMIEKTFAVNTKLDMLFQLTYEDDLWVVLVKQEASAFKKGDVNNEM